MRGGAVARTERVFCVSWDASLAVTRRMLLSQAGYDVISALGEAEARKFCMRDADLMVLGHSVPQDQKQIFIEAFRQHSPAPVLSLLRPGQRKLPEATLGLEAIGPEDFIHAVRNILPLSA
jgi:DNA-binding response OmpR family regulator